jgi:hypothetical protein
MTDPGATVAAMENLHPLDRIDLHELHVLGNVLSEVRDRADAIERDLERLRQVVLGAIDDDDAGELALALCDEVGQWADTLCSGSVVLDRIALALDSEDSKD